MTQADLISTEKSDEIHIVPMVKSDVDAVHKFILGDFRKFEPMNAAMKLSVEEADEFFKGTYDKKFTLDTVIKRINIRYQKIFWNRVIR